jgi:integrase
VRPAGGVQRWPAAGARAGWGIAPGSTGRRGRGAGRRRRVCAREKGLCISYPQAIFLVAYRHGLRASEIGLLQRVDVDAKQGRISIHRLKGSLSGMYPMQPDVLKAIRSCLRIRADESPYLFLSKRGVPISRYTLHHLMQTYGKTAGLPMEKRKFHCLKHSIATHLLDAGADLAFVKDWDMPISRIPPSMRGSRRLH